MLALLTNVGNDGYKLSVLIQRLVWTHRDSRLELPRVWMPPYVCYVFIWIHDL